MTIAETHSPAGALPVYTFGTFRYDATDRLLTRDGIELALPPRVIGVLHVLLENHGRVVSKRDLIEAVWAGTFVTETSLTEAISLLRQALGDEPQSPSFVQTVHRRGYRFVAPVTPVEREERPVAVPVRLAPADPVVVAIPKPASRRTAFLIPGAIAAALILVAAVAVFYATRSRAVKPDLASRPSHLTVAIPQGPTLIEWTPSIAISPDGREVVFAATRGEDIVLHHRSLDSFETRVLEGTTGATMPFFSPDGEWLGFVSDRALMKMRLAGGTPITICKAERVYGATWGADGTIVFGSSLSGLRRVSANGGTPVVITRPNASRGEVMHIWPELLPDGRSLLFTIFTNTLSSSKVALLSLDTGERKVLLESAAGARYSASGHLVYARPETIAAVAFDASGGRVTGSPVALLKDVAVNPFTGSTQLALSRNGTLLYMPLSRALPERGLARLKTNGQIEALPTPPRYYRNLEIAPDGRRAAVTILENDRSDVWIAGLEDGSLERVTFDGFNIEPVWSHDGEWIYYASNRAGAYNIYRRRANGDGAAERVMASARHQHPYFWSPDGRYLVFGEAAEGTGFDVWLAEASGWKTTPFMRSRAHEGVCEVSPDGNWIAYQSDESGTYEIYLRAFPRGQAHRQISSDGGFQPFWSADGRTLYYHANDSVMAVAVDSGTLKSETVVQTTGKFSLAQRGAGGGRLTFVRNLEQPAHPTELRLILGWEALLGEARAAGRK